MSNATLLSVVTEIQSLPSYEQLRDLCVHVKRQADLAWDACAEARARLDESTAEFHRGRAHAFCEILGDQANLSSRIDGFAPNDPEQVGNCDHPAHRNMHAHRHGAFCENWHPIYQRGT